MERLLEGNRRYAAMRQLHPHQDQRHRRAVLEGQQPFAVILGCSDSRVPSELIFDQGLGDLFIVRVAGHVLDDYVLASLEFAVHVLATPLVVTLGHSQCGAVNAAISGSSMPGHISQLAKGVRPAIEAAQHLPGDLWENAIRVHTRLTAAQLPVRSPILAQAVQEDRIKIVAAYYDLATGLVTVLEPAPAVER